MFIGVLHDAPVGTSNGHIEGRRLFDCPNKHGGFYPAEDIVVERRVDDAEASGSPPATAWDLVRQVVAQEPESLDDANQAAAVAVAAKCSASGRGLQTAVVGQVSQVTITCNDTRGRRRETGGDAVSVAVRGVSPPSKLRVKLHDHGNGHYVAEYKAEVSGQLTIHVTINGQPLPGSPFSVTALTLRPDPVKCELRGDALTSAIARKTMAFEIDFIDALGNPAVAEDLDMRLERIEPLPADVVVAPADRGNGEDESQMAEEKAAMEERLAAVGTLRLFLSKAAGLDSADLNGKSDPYVTFGSGEQKAKSSVKPKTLSPVWNEDFEMEGTLQSFVDTGLLLRIFDCDNPLKPEKDDELGQKHISLDFLRHENTCQFTEFLSGGIANADIGVKSVAKGKVLFSVTWEPPGTEEEAASGWCSGDERVVIGNVPLILREGYDKRSRELLKLPPGTRLQLHEVREIADGFRTRVRVVSLPGPAAAMQPPSVLGSKWKEVGLDKPANGNEIFNEALAAALSEKLEFTKKEVDKFKVKDLAVDSFIKVRNDYFEQAAAKDPPEGTVGWITAAHSDGRKRLMKKHHKLEANVRRYQLELWSRRVAADKKIHIASSNKEGKAPVIPSYTHEITECKGGIAFAFGGVYPGTIHAHGALVKTHQVSYSVGAAGKYMVHIGLRQQSAILPGSPFPLEVKPGQAHAQSTKLPEESLPLETVVGTQGRLVIQMSDCMGNKCNEGGAPLEVSVSSGSIDKWRTALTCKCEDQQDGTFLVTWVGERSGKFTLEMKLHNVHLVGSPAPLSMVAADLDISQCELIVPREAVAGEASKIQTHCRDAFGNAVEFAFEAGLTPPFGMLLIPLQSGEKTLSRSSSNKDDRLEEKRHIAAMKKEERANLVKTLESMDFDGSWAKSTHNMSFIPQEAGDFELHVWCDAEGTGSRSFLPGCPFSLHVGAGKASATGSLVKDVAAVGPLSAGDRLVLKVQICDEFNNHASLGAPEDIVAMLDTPEGQVGLVLKSTEKSEEDKPPQPVRQTSKKSSVANNVSSVGMYEIVSPMELTLKGQHMASILLQGQPITGAPVEFTVKPSGPVSYKSWLEVEGGVQPIIDTPIYLVLHLVDKFGNSCEHGDVRVDARVFGSKASECKVADGCDGTFSINFTAGVPGDYKVQCRLENADLQVLQLHVIEGEKAPAPDDMEEAAREEELLTQPPDVIESASPAQSALPPAPLMPDTPPPAVVSATAPATESSKKSKSGKKKGGAKTGRPDSATKKESKDGSKTVRPASPKAAPKDGSKTLRPASPKATPNAKDGSKTGRPTSATKKAKSAKKGGSTVRFAPPPERSDLLKVDHEDPGVE